MLDGLSACAGVFLCGLCKVDSVTAFVLRRAGGVVSHTRFSATYDNQHGLQLLCCYSLNIEPFGSCQCVYHEVNISLAMHGV
jgi:hypothetical protein